MKDLVVLVEGRADERTLKALLERPQALDIRSITFDVFAHPQSGSGCLNDAVSFFRAIDAITRYRYALVVFDREGCGRDHVAPEDIEEEVRSKLESNDWPEHAGVVVIDPELEIWVWSVSPHVDQVLGWQDRNPSLSDWLRQKNYVEASQAKPSRPKEALEAALREVRKPFSSSVHAELAQKVSTRNCTDRSFRCLRDLLNKWFPPS